MSSIYTTRRRVSSAKAEFNQTNRYQQAIRPVGIRDVMQPWPPVTIRKRTWKEHTEISQCLWCGRSDWSLESRGISPCSVHSGLDTNLLTYMSCSDCDTTDVSVSDPDISRSASDAPNGVVHHYSREIGIFGVSIYTLDSGSTTKCLACESTELAGFARRRDRYSRIKPDHSQQAESRSESE